MFALNKETITVRGEKLEVQEMTGRQRSELPKLKDQGIDMGAYMIKACVPKLSHMELDEILDMPGAVLDEISEAVMRISGLSDVADKEAEKNS